MDALGDAQLEATPRPCHQWRWGPGARPGTGGRGHEERKERSEARTQEERHGPGPRIAVSLPTGQHQPAVGAMTDPAPEEPRQKPEVRTMLKPRGRTSGRELARNHHRPSAGGLETYWRRWANRPLASVTT